MNLDLDKPDFTLQNITDYGDSSCFPALGCDASGPDIDSNLDFTIPVIRMDRDDAKSEWGRLSPIFPMKSTF